MSKLSFVIPCYGSESTIETVIAEIMDTVSQRPEWDYEIICVNDASPDHVLAILKGLAGANPKVIAADLTRNMGKHSAVMAGYSLVTGDIIINLDDDGQCPMDRLWDLLAPLDDGYDIVMAKYPVKKQSPFKNFGSSVNALMSRFLLNRPKDLAVENFSAVKRFIIDEVVKYRNPYPYLEGLLLRSTGKIANVTMNERERMAGSGNFTWIRSVKLWLNGFTAFSVKPLRVSSVLGSMIAFAGFLYGVFIVIRRMFFSDMAIGYPSTMAALLFIGGMIMMMLGMVGEYVGRIYISINNSPQYVIREVYRGGSDFENC